MSVRGSAQLSKSSPLVWKSFQYTCGDKGKVKILHSANRQIISNICSLSSLPCKKKLSRSACSRFCSFPWEWQNTCSQCTGVHLPLLSSQSILFFPSRGVPQHRNSRPSRTTQSSLHILPYICLTQQTHVAADRGLYAPQRSRKLRK